LALK
jgi:hypothetical protein